MAKTFILHDETVNTYGFRMLTSGADLTEFRKNPVMLLNHSDRELPVGRWENIRVESGRILADAVFDMEDERGRQLEGKVSSGFVNAASIGAWPPEEISDDESLRYPGQKSGTITRWKVREASIVTIGSNHNALALYDNEGNTVDLTDSRAIIKLFDNTNFKQKKESKMNILKGILNLSDTATDNEVAACVRSVISDRDRLKAENVTLKDHVDRINSAEKAKKTTEATALVDAAIKDGRLNASARESSLKLFDTDFDSARATLAAIPSRKSVTGRIDQASGDSAVGLSDLQKKDWDTLDREGKLVMLRDTCPDLYREKFKARFGCDPK